MAWFADPHNLQFWHYSSADRVGTRRRSYSRRSDVVVAEFFDEDEIGWVARRLIMRIWLTS
jgi:hypothetical protein